MPPSNNDSDPPIGDIAGLDGDLDAIARMEKKIQATLARVWGDQAESEPETASAQAGRMAAPATVDENLDISR